MKRINRLKQITRMRAKAGARARWMLLVALVAGVMALAGCTSSKPGAVAPVKATPSPVTSQVAVGLFAFSPTPLAVKVGTKVTWTNNDDIEHSVTQGKPPTAADGGFNSGFFTKGQTFSYTFAKTGAFSYFCMRHNSMTGEVDVTQ